MGKSISLESTVDAAIEKVRRSARVPGVAVAIVSADQIEMNKGYGHCDLHGFVPMSPETIYPIASTTKAINATVLGMLVDEGKVAWDVPVQNYLPSFRLGNAGDSARITVRDLVVMRTGLPRHDWMWMGSSFSSTEIIDRIRYLELSAGPRERYQYNNLTTITAGHIAEIASGQGWDRLVQTRIFDPLGMGRSSFDCPATGNVTRSYHENWRRELVETRRVPTHGIAAAGGSIHSTITDMARWAMFNVNGGRIGDRSLISPRTIAEIHSPQVLSGSDTAAPTPGAPYAMGWFVDSHIGRQRLSHGGYLHDVNSEVLWFPEERVGAVAFVNFGPSRLARVFCQSALDLFMGWSTGDTLNAALTAYEGKVAENRRRLQSARRVLGTRPSHHMHEYVGAYRHLGYGQLDIQERAGALFLEFNGLELALEHWHYDVWVVADNDLFEIHMPHAFDPLSRVLFEANAEGDIAALFIPLEPDVAPIRFVKSLLAPLRDSEVASQTT